MTHFDKLLILVQAPLWYLVPY